MDQFVDDVLGFFDVPFKREVLYDRMSQTHVQAGVWCGEGRRP